MGQLGGGVMLAVRSHRGFSLVEVVVLIVILGLGLVGINRAWMAYSQYIIQQHTMIKQMDKLEWLVAGFITHQLCLPQPYPQLEGCTDRYSNTVLSQEDQVVLEQWQPLPSLINTFKAKIILDNGQYSISVPMLIGIDNES